MYYENCYIITNAIHPHPPQQSQFYQLKSDFVCIFNYLEEILQFATHQIQCCFWVLLTLWGCHDPCQNSVCIDKISYSFVKQDKVI